MAVAVCNFNPFSYFFFIIFYFFFGEEGMPKLNEHLIKTEPLQDPSEKKSDIHYSETLQTYTQKIPLNGTQFQFRIKFS